VSEGEKESKKEEGEAIEDEDDFLAEFNKTAQLDLDHRLLLDCCLPLLHSRSSGVCVSCYFFLFAPL
jgi:hypothetical protein